MKNKGLVQEIVIIIVAIVLLSLIGIDPVGIWEDFIKPIFIWIIDLIIEIIDYIVASVDRFVN